MVLATMCEGAHADRGGDRWHAHVAFERPAHAPDAAAAECRLKVVYVVHYLPLIDALALTGLPLFVAPRMARPDHALGASEGVARSCCRRYGAA